MDDLKTLEARAAAGEAAAQYALAARYDGLGRFEEARALTRKAADAGHAGALYTLAAEMLSVASNDIEIPLLMDTLCRAAEAGGGAALRQLGVLTAMGFGTSNDWGQALKYVAIAARSQYPPAMRDLACLAHMAGAQKSQTAGLLRAAALTGDWIAVYLGLYRGDIFTGDEASVMAQRFVKGGAPLSANLPRDGAEKPVSTETDIDALEALVATFDPRNQVSRKEMLNEAPDVFHAVNILTTDECHYLICAAAGLLRRSRVVDSDKAGADHAAFRTSDEATFGLLDLDLTLLAISQRLAAAAGAKPETCELMGVLRYQPGQEYKPHHDFLPVDASDYSQVKKCGQRMRTILVPLNEGFGGGETIFPKLDISFRGGAGDALVFHNTDDTGAPYPETLHAGAPVTSGEKWLLTIWVREKRFWFWD